MIKANELRLGNIICLPSQSSMFTYKVTSIGPEAVNGFDLEECDPLPLTEAWLLNVGFKLDHPFNDGGICVANHIEFPFFIRKTVQNFWRLDPLSFDADYMTKKPRPEGDGPLMFLLNSTIIYMHQLQNLFFAITGKELIP